MIRSARPLPLLLLLACSADQPPAIPGPTPHLLSLVAGELAAAVPDTVPAGAVRIEFRHGITPGHNVVVFAIDDTTRIAEFLAAADTAEATPAGARALGGPESGDDPALATVVVLDLKPGEYLIGCPMRDASRHRHMSGGEYRRLVVVPATEPAAVPAPTFTLGMADFAYVVGDTWPSGEHLIKVVNRGPQDHLVLIARMHPGKTLRDYMESTDSTPASDGFGGITRMGAGTEAYLPVTLTPGTWVLTCMITDPASRRLHAEMGMIRTVTVVGP